MTHPQLGAPDTDNDGRRSFRTALAVLALLCVLLLGLAALVAADPAFLVALLPIAVADSYPQARLLLVIGGAAVTLPLLAACVAASLGRKRASGWFALIFVLAVPPAYLVIHLGQDTLDRLDRARTPEPACVEFSGGQATCPGG